MRPIAVLGRVIGPLIVALATLPTRVQNGRVRLIPGSDETAGHGTTACANFWQKELAELLQSAPHRAPSSRLRASRGPAPDTGGSLRREHGVAMPRMPLQTRAPWICREGGFSELLAGCWRARWTHWR
jgi:hypothetical protein